MTEDELRRAAAAAAQREQDRPAQYLQDHQQRRDQYVEEQRTVRIATLRSPLDATFGAGIEHALGGYYTVESDPIFMDAMYDVPVGDVVLRVRHERDAGMEQWVYEVVARGTSAVVKRVPERVEVNRDRLLLVLRAMYDAPTVSTGGLQQVGGDA